MITLGKFALATVIVGSTMAPSVASAGDFLRAFLHDHPGGRQAPGPLAAAGLPALAIAGGFIYFRRRKQSAAERSL